MTSLEASGPRVITLTTDFGCRDPFVGQMKGVILSVNPSVTIVDITHDIEPHDIEGGAFVIGTSYSFFPIGTIHLCVVDPGVGSRRRALLLEAEGHCFIGPDNGLFSHILARSKTWRATQLTEGKYFLATESPTFQGRDLFAPVAAWVSTGLEPSAFGGPVDRLERFPVPEPAVQTDRIAGEIVHIDRFGNVLTNIRREHLAGLRDPHVVSVKGMKAAPVRFYAEGREGSLQWLINSSGYLELFVSCASAAGLFGIARGDAVTVVGSGG